MSDPVFFFCTYFRFDNTNSMVYGYSKLNKLHGFIGLLLLGFVKLFSKSLPTIDTKNKKRLEFFMKFSALILYGWSKKIFVIPYSIFRTEEEQTLKYQQGRTLPGRIITNVDGKIKTSKHQHWTAGDILILDEEYKSDWDSLAKYETLGLFWEAMGGTWGHRWFEAGYTKFDDLGHFEV